ncbi:symmetrical bis(5'-nucleosyl)-tetraphosphatase [soil metagenome]
MVRNSVARYAIGDIQGCKASLDRLLALIAYSRGRDELWLVGDLVNRGPRSLDVLRWAMAEPNLTCVLGNHDLHLLARAVGAQSAKKRDTLDDVLAARDLDRIIDWLRQRPLFVAEGNFAMVHGGLHPQWTVAEAKALAGQLESELRAPSWRAFLAQTSGGSKSPPPWDPRLGGGDRWRSLLSYFVRARTLKPDGRVEPSYEGPAAQAPAGCVPWFAFPHAKWTTHTVVFGHWAAQGLDLGAHHAGIDTGCVWGKSLTAIRLDDKSVFQIKAVEAVT